MSQRITEKQLEALTETICGVANQPTDWRQVGSYSLSYQCGGVALHQRQNEDGGVRDVLESGHVPKRELWNLMHAYLRGLQEGQQLGGVE